MAETIRDVTVRINLKLGDTKLDLANIKAGAAQTAGALAAAEKQARDQFKEAFRDKAALIREEGKLRRTAALENFRDEKQGIELAGKLRSQSAKEAAAYEKEKSAAIRQTGVEAIRAGDGLKRAGEGAFMLARGVAFLGASGSKDMERFVRQVAAAEGAFHIAKGSFETFKGLAGSLPQLAASAGSLATALGPVGVAAAAIGVTATASGVAVHSMWKAHTEGATRARKELEAFVSDHRRAWLEVTNQRFTLATTFEDKRISHLEDDKQSLALQTKRWRLAQEESKLAASFIGTAESNTLHRVLPGGRRVKAEVEDMERLASMRKAIAHDDERLLDLSMKQDAARERIIAKRKDEIAGVRELIRLEENKLRSEDEAFGRLRKGEQRQVLRLAEKAGSGKTLSAKELLTLESKLGTVADKFVSKQFETRGAAARLAASKDEMASRGGRLEWTKRDPFADIRGEERGGTLRKLKESIFEAGAGKALFGAEEANLEKELTEIGRRRAERAEKLLAVLQKDEERLERAELAIIEMKERQRALANSVNNPPGGGR